MDNTLLRSNINFPRMKRTVFEFLCSHEMIADDFPWSEQTASQIIETGRKHSQFSMIEGELWRLIGEIEAEGMEGAELEPYARDMLAELQKREILTVVLTNNAYQAAEKALRNTKAFDFFSHVVGREQMEKLKPSPSGIHFILRQYPRVPKEKWLFIGDSWIDGMAAKLAGIRFLAYRADQGELARRGVSYVAMIDSLKEVIAWMDQGYMRNPNR
nr:HAD-IA family hydrolase [Ammoniphilus resinae]